VLLAALGDGSGCRCQLSARVHHSSAVFLRLTQARIGSELNALRGQHLLTAAGASACESCDEAYRLSREGQDFLASCLEDWQLSQLASSAVNA
jgi:hypothetical protein